MALLVLPTTNRQQPQQVAVLDRGNPLTAGLSMAQVMGLTKQHDLVSNRLSAFVGTKLTNLTAGRASAFGSALGVGTTDKVSTPLAVALTRRAYFFMGVRNGAGGGSLGRLCDKTSGTTGQFLYWSGTNSVLTYGYYAGGVEQAVQITGTGTTAAVGVLFKIVVTHDVVGTTHTVNVFVNDAHVVTNNVVVGTSNDAAATILTIGNRASDNARNWDGHIFIGATWDRVLSAPEALALNANPWQIFRAPPAMRWVTAPAAGGTVIDLTTASLSIVASGVQNTLAAALTSASTGHTAQAIQTAVATALASASMTGVAQAVTTGIAAQFAAGTLTFAGQAIALTSTTLIALSSAVLSLAPRALTVTYSSLASVGHWLATRRRRR